MPAKYKSEVEKPTPFIWLRRGPEGGGEKEIFIAGVDHGPCAIEAQGRQLRALLENRARRRANVGWELPAVWQTPRVRKLCPRLDLVRHA